MKTLLLTGKMGSGKSSFINELFMLLNVPLTGIRSVRHYEGGKFIGFDMSLIEDFIVKKTWSVARFMDGEMRVNTNFKGATDFLEAMKSHEPIFIDEVGRFERNDSEYLKAVEILADSELKSIISLKKEDLPFNNHLIDKSRKDNEIKYIDLDRISKDELDAFLLEVTGITEEKTKKTVLYSEEFEGDIASSESNSRIQFHKIDNIFDITVEFFLKQRGNTGIFYYYTKNVDEMKKAADIGFIALDDLNKI